MCGHAATLQASGFMGRKYMDRNVFVNTYVYDQSLTQRVWLLQSGSSGHAGECVQRLGDHHHLPPQQQAAGGGGPLHQADGQCV